MKIFNIKYKNRTIILFLMIILISCAPRINKHGNFLTKEELRILKNTKLNKSEIVEIFGQPTTKSTFSNNVWYYISLIQKERAYFEVRNVKKNVLKITFNKDQNVDNYRITSDKASLNIKVNSDTTYTSLEEKETFLQGLFASLIKRLENPNTPVAK